MTAHAASPPSAGPGIRRAGAVVAGIAVGLGLGATMAAVATMFGPLVAVGLPVVAGGLVLGLRRPVWGLVPLLATFPLSQVDVAGVNAVQLGATATVGLVVGLRLLRGETLVRLPPLWRWLVVLWVLSLVTAVVGIAPQESMPQVLLLATGVALTFVLATATADALDLRLALWLVLVVAGTMCALSLAGFGSAQAAFGGTVIEGRSQGSFAQPNELGTFAAMTTMLAAGWLIGPSHRGRLLAGAVALVAGAALLASLSRGAWIGTALGIVAIVLLRPRSRRLIVGGLLGVVVAAAVGVSLAPAAPQVDVVRARFESFADPTGNPYDDRPAIYAEGLRQVRARPLTGFGPAGFRVEASRQLEGGGSSAPHHAHNTLLAISAETGLVTTAVLLAFTLVAAGAARRRMRELSAPGVGPGDRVRDAVLTGSAAALCVLVGQGLVDFSLRNPTLHFTVFVLLGLLLSTLRRTAQP